MQEELLIEELGRKHHDSLEDYPCPCQACQIERAYQAKRKAEFSMTRPDKPRNPRGGICDWGGCSYMAQDSRWHEADAVWLPVCSDHQEAPQEPQEPLPPPSMRGEDLPHAVPWNARMEVSCLFCGSVEIDGLVGPPFRFTRWHCRNETCLMWWDWDTRDGLARFEGKAPWIR